MALCFLSLGDFDMSVSSKVTPKGIRHTLILKGYIKPKFGNRVDQLPGHAVAVRRVDDRPVTRQIPVMYKSA
jgi:hypothetical protein